MDLWMVNYLHRWDCLQLTNGFKINAKIEGEPHVYGFLPVFDDYDAALEYAKGDAGRIQAMELEGE